ncbi:MAG: hypothetical protein KDC46_06965, partial [Thermoleophilia bacterium]|nr:hypothetical protein [Thermoleophilia bacterium]
MKYEKLTRPIAIAACAGALVAGGALITTAVDHSGSSFEPSLAAQQQPLPGGPQGQRGPGGPGGPQGQQGPGGPGGP